MFMQLNYKIKRYIKLKDKQIQYNFKLSVTLCINFVQHCVTLYSKYHAKKNFI